MKKFEAKFCSIYQQFLMVNGSKYDIPSAPWEAKYCRIGDSIPFSDVPTHQINALLASASDAGFCYKISDQSSGVKGFDGFYFRNAKSYLVFAYKHHFYLIDIQVFVKEKFSSERKSLTEQRASDICFLSHAYHL